MKPRIISLLLLSAFLLTGCRQEKVYRIGVSQCSDDDWRSKMNDEINREMIFHDNAVVEIRSANDDNFRQEADIRYFADNGFDIIVAAPNEADALTPVIKEVYERGIPVLLFDRNINDESYTAWQGADNVAVGREAAGLAMSLQPGECRVIEIRGLEGSTPAEGRHEGFAAVCAENPERLRLLGSGYGDWNGTDGRRVADSLLWLYPDANFVYAHNDRMAIAAAEAARAAGRRG
ncbi:MAG: substrate-binding domain-containing protein [Clostridium sp.]|nr:substrate-binding domain-containing protein [Clostridium sp.]